VSELKKKLTINELPKSEQKVVANYQSLGTWYERVQVATYESSTEPLIQNMINELKEAGGQMYQIIDREFGKTQDISLGSNAFFSVTEEGLPEININLLSNDYSLSALSHEFKHFKNWKQTKAKYKALGFMSDKKASRAAQRYLLQPKLKRADEHMAVWTELAKDAETDSVFNRAYFKRHRDDSDILSISRKSYPEISLLRSTFYHFRGSRMTPQIKEISINIVQGLIEKALFYRSKALAAYPNQDLASISLFHLIFNRDLSQFPSKDIELLAEIYDLARQRLSLKMQEQMKDFFIEDSAELYMIKNFRYTSNLFSEQQQQQQQLVQRN
jgi:hypothetical protein